MDQTKEAIRPRAGPFKCEALGTPCSLRAAISLADLYRSTEDIYAFFLRSSTLVSVSSARAICCPDQHWRTSFLCRVLVQVVA